jgi:hypothetical protein
MVSRYAPFPGSFATRNPQPATRNPQPATRNPQPATRNPQPATRNPQPATRNPQSAIYFCMDKMPTWRSFWVRMI